VAPVVVHDLRCGRRVRHRLIAARRRGPPGWRRRRRAGDFRVRLTYISAMLRISGANWIHEIKHDGYRRNLAKFATHADARARP
jgi:hypothetical protein